MTDTSKRFLTTMSHTGVLYDDNLEFCFTQDTKQGQSNYRFEYDGMDEPSQMDLLNDNPNIVSWDYVRDGAFQNILTEGSCTLEFKWTENENITQSDLDEYETYLLSQLNWNITKDLDNKTFTASYIYDAPFTEWSPAPVAYLLKTPEIKLTLDSDNSEILCCSRKMEDWSGWNIRNIDIPATTTKSLDRPDCTNCYMVFCKEVSIGETVIEKWAVRNIESASIDITNNNTEPCKVVQYYK